MLCLKEENINIYGVLTDGDTYRFLKTGGSLRDGSNHFELSEEFNDSLDFKNFNSNKMIDFFYSLIIKEIEIADKNLKNADKRIHHLCM